VPDGSGSEYESESESESASDDEAGDALPPVVLAPSSDGPLAQRAAFVPLGAPFRLDVELFECEAADFLVPYHRYAAAVVNGWQLGLRVKAMFMEPGADFWEPYVETTLLLLLLLLTGGLRCCCPRHDCAPADVLPLLPHTSCCDYDC